MATVNKNFKIKNGLVVEGATATVNGNDVLTKSAADTTYIQGLVGGVANSQSVANAIVLRDANASFAANVVTADLVGDVTGTVSDISNHDTDALAEGTTNKYFSNTLARDAFSAGTGITLSNGEISVTSGTYDAAGSADTAQTNAQNYADSLASNYDAAGSASTAQTNAVTIANDYTDEAVANLVNGAPELLDTLNELAAALDDNPNVIADLQDIASNKQDTLVAGTGIDIAGNTISVTTNTYDAYGSADTAQTNAQNYADSLAGNYDSSGSASTAQTNAQNYADSLASNYDAAGSADTAQTNAQNYADNAISTALYPGGAFAFDTYGSANTAQTNAQNYADSLAGNYDASGSASTAQTNAQNYADSLASNYDAAGSASTAQTNAQNYADSLASNYDAAGSASTAQTNAQNYADSLASNYDAAGSASTAQTNAQNYADSVADTAQTNAQNYADSAVSALVDSAPELLNTLNELAAAIGDDANFATTLTNLVATKQDTLTAGSNIDITGNTISVTGVDLAGSADTAQTNAVTIANSYTDTEINSLTTDDIEEGLTNLYFTNALAVSALEAVTPNFQSVDITWVRREEATWTDANTAGTFTAHTFGTNEGSVKYLVRIFNNGESQVSEVLVTTDSNNNIAVTEYATIYTSENPLATVTADWNAGSSEYRLRVTTANNNSEILVAATLIAYND